MKTQDLYTRAVEIQTERRQVAVDGKLSPAEKAQRGKALAAELARINKNLQAAIYDDMRQLAGVERVLSGAIEKARGQYRPDFGKLAYYADRVKSIVKGGKYSDVEKAYKEAQARGDLDELQAWKDAAPGLLAENKYQQQDQFKALDLKHQINAWEPVDLSEFQAVADQLIKQALEVRGIARDAGNLFFNDPAYRTPAGTYASYFDECATVGGDAFTISLDFAQEIPAGVYEAEPQPAQPESKWEGAPHLFRLADYDRPATNAGE